MSNGDYDYFGKGDAGYAQYMTAFERNFSTDSTDSTANTQASDSTSN